jgi:hypothetical protein
MRIANVLWRDESGLILSAEAVMVGTVGVLGAVVGLNMTTTAVNDELKEFAFAIRSLDQSYGFAGHRSCGAWSAGSYYQQQDVQVSLQELCADGATDIRAIQQEIEAQRTRLPEAPLPQADPDQAIPVAPNQIPVPEANVDKLDSKPVEKRRVPDRKVPPRNKPDDRKTDRDDV